MNRTIQNISGLNCHVLDAISDGSSFSLVVLLCHGFGATGQDLVPIGDQLLRDSPQIREHVQFVFPEAPLSLGGFGPFESRAWWMIDTVGLDTAIANGEFIGRSSDCPDELPKVRRTLLSIIDQLQHDTGLGLSRFVLGGFSQGAMVSLDATLHLSESPAALCLWSGTLRCESLWRELMPKRSGLEVLQSHGKQDPLLSFSVAETLRDLMRDSGLSVDFVEFEGPHTIPYAVLQKFTRMVEAKATST